MTRLKDGEALAEGLCGALLGEAAGFVDALYDADGIEDEDVRPLVAMHRDEAAKMIGRVKEKLAPASCEVARREQKGTTHVVEVVVNGTTKLEVVFDDVYERGGGLRTRDLLQFRLK
jgi:hypothetical protein